MKDEQLAAKVEVVLWELLCLGGGDGRTIRRYAKRIAKLLKEEAK